MPSLAEVIWSLFLIALTMVLTSLFQTSLDSLRDNTIAYLRFFSRELTVYSLRSQCSRIVKFHKAPDRFYAYAISKVFQVLFYISFFIIYATTAILGSLRDPKDISDTTITILTIVTLVVIAINIFIAIGDLPYTAWCLYEYEKYTSKTLDRLVSLTGKQREVEEQMVGIRIVAANKNQ